jgi:hypothetical protein
MKAEGRIVLDKFPEDWRYYTLTFPAARYRNLSLDEALGEMSSCDYDFYSVRHIARRVWGNLWRWRHPFISFVGNISYRANLRTTQRAYEDFRREQGGRYARSASR